jgi:hypothetical protein
VPTAEGRGWVRQRAGHWHCHLTRGVAIYLPVRPLVCKSAEVGVALACEVHSEGLPYPFGWPEARQPLHVCQLHHAARMQN